MRENNAGQSLLEVMIALSVLTAGFLGILSLLSQSLFISKTINNQIVATYLAEEGIEISKNLIDHDIYQTFDQPSFGGWFRNNPNTDPTFPTAADYQVDYTTCNGIGFDVLCGPAPNYTGSFLGFDPATGLYSYGGPMATPFTRKIHVIASTPTEVDLQSIVSWSIGPFTSQNVILEDAFYNWHP
jgi:hypothetical protein